MSIRPAFPFSTLNYRCDIRHTRECQRSRRGFCRQTKIECIEKCRKAPRQEGRHGMGNFWFLASAVLSAAIAASAQSGPQYQQPESAVPVLTGYVGFNSGFEPGQQELSPTIAPVVLLPIGERWLIESETEFEGSYTHQAGQPWERKWNKGIEYAQIDFFASKNVTLVGGRFLTPFGIFNERLHSGWIRNLSAEPIIAALEMSASNGGMVRGGIPAGRNLNVNYAGFVSASSDNPWFLATRATGGRVGFFFPRARFELGASYRRTLEGEKMNTVGVDWTWQLNHIPLDIRGEFARNASSGSGYWLEGTYRMRKVPLARAFMQKSQAAVRVEQFFTPNGSSGGGMSELPDVNTKRLYAGWSYWIRPDVRANFAYGRQFNADGDRNIWTVGATYRFAFPLTKPATPDSQQSTAPQSQPAKTWHLPKGWTADDAYKSNCTRCHAEVPKLDPRRTKTIMRHMRVRANLTKDEAEAILDYLKE